MKPTQDERALDPIVGRALLPEHGGPVGGQPPVGRAKAALADLKMYLVGAKNEALESRRAEGPSLDTTMQILTADRAFNALADLTRELALLETEEPRAANDKLSEESD